MRCEGRGRFPRVHNFGWAEQPAADNSMSVVGSHRAMARATLASAVHVRQLCEASHDGPVRREPGGSAQPREAPQTAICRV